MMKSRFLRSTLHRALTLAVLSFLVACDSTPTPTPCYDVPDGGCPEDNGANVCMDPSCAAVYACEDGHWKLSQTCPPHPHDGSAPPADAGGEASPVFDASIDVPPGGNGGPGCPDLELPDCTASEGLACVQSPGCCGCMDLWVCDDGGWTLWGECVNGGIVLQK
jgi:hypothetical protein